jgi:predicted molibdopterin-dependent oxidoreductase YjgC
LDSLWHLAKQKGIFPSFNIRKEEISRAKVIFLAGTDLAISHPILWLEVLKAIRNGAKLVTASPYELVGNRHASLWLQIKPGSEDLLFMYLSKLIHKEENSAGHDLEGYQSLTRALDKLDISAASEDTGINEESLCQAATMLMNEESLFIAGMGLSPSAEENKNLATLWNLSLLCKGKLIPLGTENNQRGIFEIRRKSTHKVKHLSQILQNVQEGQIKALYTMGPVPLAKKIKTEFLVVQDSYMNEVAERADVVLPATTFAEADGTFVNVEGRIQSYSRIIQPMGEARPDWWILSQLAKRRGKKNFAYKKSQDIVKEMKKTIPSFVSMKISGNGKGKGQFVKGLGKGDPKFVPMKARISDSTARNKFPYALYSEYNLDTYRNLVLSREIKSFGLVRNARWIMINPEDAKALKLKEGEGIIMESALGKNKGIAKISEDVPRGTVRASFLWSEGTEESCYPLPVKIKRGK